MTDQRPPDIAQAHLEDIESIKLTIRSVLALSPKTLTKSQIQQHFESGHNRALIKEAIAQLVSERELIRTSSGYTASKRATGAMVVRITDAGNADKGLPPLAEPVSWTQGYAQPLIVLPLSLARQGCNVGDKALVQTKSVEKGFRLRVHVTQHLAKDERSSLVARFKRGAGRLLSSHVEAKIGKLQAAFKIAAVDGHESLLEDGNTVIASIDETQSQFRPKIIVDNHWSPDNDPKPLSLLTRVEHGLNDYPVKMRRRLARQAKKPVFGEYHDDMRHLPFVTIDGPDAKDFDDAVAALPDTSADNPGGHILYVAVADVANYVQDGTALDREARMRGSSVYLPEEAVHMLPAPLSEDLCSLRPQVDRLAIITEMRLSASGEVLESRYHRSVINSHARLEYGQADSMLDGTAPHGDPKVQASLLRLSEIHASLKDAANDRGALDMLETKPLLVRDGRRILGFENRPGVTSPDLIEKLMVLTNSVNARDLTMAGEIFIGRTQTTPTAEDFIALGKLLEKAGATLPENGIRSPKDLNSLLDSVADRENLYYTYRNIILRNMNAARYEAIHSGLNNKDVQAVTHFCLQLEHYGHFTSPIRRYPDLNNQRALIRAFDLGPEEPETKPAQLQRMVENQNDLRDQLQRMTNESWERYELAYLAAETKKRVPGILYHIGKDKIQMKLNGLPSIRSFSSDIFRDAGFDVDHKQGVLRHKGKTYQPEEAVNLRLDHVDPILCELRFTPMTEEDAIAVPKSKRYDTRFPLPPNTKTKTDLVGATLVEASTRGVVVKLDNSDQELRFPATSFFSGSVKATSNGVYAYALKRSFESGERVAILQKTVTKQMNGSKASSVSHSLRHNTPAPEKPAEQPASIKPQGNKNAYLFNAVAQTGKEQLCRLTKLSADTATFSLGRASFTVDTQELAKASSIAMERGNSYYVSITKDADGSHSISLRAHMQAANTNDNALEAELQSIAESSKPKTSGRNARETLDRALKAV